MCFKVLGANKDVQLVRLANREVQWSLYSCALSGVPARKVGQLLPALKCSVCLFLGGLGPECSLLNKMLLKYMLANAIRTR